MNLVKENKIEKEEVYLDKEGYNYYDNTIDAYLVENNTVIQLYDLNP